MKILPQSDTPHLLLAFCAAVLVCWTAWRIADTYTVFSQTWDEGAHLACGIEWFDRGVYRYDTQHPPLSRIAVAFLPYRAGMRSQGHLRFWDEGNAILHSTGDYRSALASARLGVLPFFVILVVVVWLWGRLLYGQAAGLAAVIALCGLPVVLAHSGLATTDIPFTAVFCGSLLAVTWWLQRRTLTSASVAGILCGLALATKFSFLIFFPACLLVLSTLALCRHWHSESIAGRASPEDGEGS